MKALIGLIVFSVVTSSCMNHYCHTYDGIKGHSNSAVSAKKAKTPKSRVPHFKVAKFAEKD